MTESGPTPENGSERQAAEEVLTVLADETRRATLQALRDEQSRTLEDLAVALADDESVSLDSPERIGHRLHHCHLPRIETAGLCRYDADGLRVEYVGDGTVERVLSSLSE